MSKKIKSFVLVVLVTAVLSSCLAGCGGRNENASFEYWNEDAQSLSELKEYVKDVTEKSSSHFIPEEDRIAVFDMDGTLYGELAPIYIEWLMYAYRVNEDPGFLPDDEEKAVADQIVEAAKDGPFISKDDFKQRTKCPQAVVDKMADMGLLGDIPESNQISIFDFMM